VSRKTRSILENVKGMGAVYHGEEFIRELGYDITVWQEWLHSSGAAPIEGLQEITGLVFDINSPIGVADLVDGRVLTLHLEDGRRLDFFIRNSDGEIANSGPDGLYEPSD